MSLLLFFCAVRMASVDARVDAEVCGRNALSVVAACNGLEVEPDRLDRLLPDDAAPFSFTDLEGAAGTLGLETYFVRWPRAEAARFDCPAILRVRSQPESTEPDHFIVCFGRSGEGILASDFPSAPRPLPLDRLSKIWDGEVLYVEAQPARTIGALRAAKTRRFIAWCALAIGAALIALAFVRKLIRGRNPDMVNDLRRSLSMASCALRMPRFARVAAIAALLALPTTLRFFGTGTAEPRATLTADPDLMTVDLNDDAGKKRRVAFRLTNPTKLPITIERVESGCACMAVRPLQHETVPPGGSVLQEVDVAIPETGRAVRSIQVYHDAAREPLVLRARVSGKNRLPFVARKVNVMPVFSNLSDSHDAQKVVIETRERLASKPWVMGLVCDHDAVKIEPLGVDERPVAELESWRELIHGLSVGSKFRRRVNCRRPSG